MTTSNSAAHSYETMLLLPRDEISLYELEHPPYTSDEDFIAIMRSWEQKRAEWSRMWKEPLPRPKRGRGRPQKAKEAKATTSMWLRVRLTDELVLALSSVKGDLSYEECARQLLVSALGPLIDRSEVKK